VLWYAESVGVVTSGHVTKMAVKPFEPPFTNTPCYTQTARFYLLYNRIFADRSFTLREKGIWRIFAEK